MESTMWYAECNNPDCDVLTFNWRKPGDSCPSCGWGGPAYSKPITPNK